MNQLLTISSAVLALSTLSACGASVAAPAPQPTDVQSATAELSPPADAPAAIQVPAGNSAKLKVAAEGVQIYQCTASASGTYSWVLLAPEADLTNDDGDFAGNHFLGPSWQLRDGSKAKGTRVAGVTVDPTAVPWLLLSATTSGRPGKLSDVTYIQRVHTSGGLANPAVTCDAAAAFAGARQSVGYTAEYYFYRASSSHTR